MKRAVICGAGRMGIAIGFAMKSLGYELSIVETNEDNISRFFGLNGKCPCYDHWSQIPKADVVISALPYHATLDAALWAIDNGMRYCDLGGSVPVSTSIKNIAESKAKVPVMTDLGLAPGWINIVAEDMYRKIQNVKGIKMFVGGLPEIPNQDDPLNYMTTWSIDGLINEYIDDCEVLSNGKIVTVPGMSGYEIVGDYEAFCTSGGAAHTLRVMQSRGLSDCVYKTLRYKGHKNLIKFLIDAFSEDRNGLEKILTTSTRHHNKDMVAMIVQAKVSDGSLDWNRKIKASENFTAMQRATAFPISTVADMMAKGMLDSSTYLTYDMIPYDAFNETLTMLLKSDLPAE